MASETRTITGTVGQILEPDDHSRYAIGEVLEEEAAGKYIVVMNTDEKPGFIGQMRDWLRDPGGPVEWAPTLVFESVSFETGDEITVEATAIEMDHEPPYYMAHRVIEV